MHSSMWWNKLYRESGDKKNIKTKDKLMKKLKKNIPLHYMF